MKQWVIGLLLSLSSFVTAADCHDNEYTEKLCDAVDAAESCLTNSASCPGVNTVGGRLTAGLVFLGKAEGMALQMKQSGPIDGQVEMRLRSLTMRLPDPAWWARSRDGHWINAVDQANESIRESLKNISEVIR